MKRVLLVLLLAPFLGMGQQKGFVINGSLSGLKNNTLVSLTDINNPTDTIAKSVVANNTFTLKSELTEPRILSINFSDAKKKTFLFLDNSNVTLNGDLAEVQKMKVSGSPTHKDFEDFQQIFMPLFTKLGQVENQIKMTGPVDNLSAQSEKITNEIQAAIDKFLQERKGSYVSPFVIGYTAQLSDDVQLMESRYNGLADNVKKGGYGQEVKKLLDVNKIGAVGSSAIEFTQNDPEGKPVSLSSFRGRYVLLDFWASWCGPCRQENPNVVSAFNKYKGRNFTVLGVSLDRSRDPWVKAIKDDNLTWTHLLDLNSQVALKYNVQFIPKNFLIDPNGKIIARNLRGAQLEQRLDQLLK